MTRIERYPYGFILGERIDLKVPDTFKLLSLNEDYYFHYDPVSSLKYKSDADRFIIIHGHFTYTKVGYSLNNDELLEELLTNYFGNYSQFLDIIDYLAGRYIIAIGDKEEVNIYNDAAGTRSVYYSLTDNLVSSHVFLLSENQENIVDELVKKYRNLPKISTKTPFGNIKSLLPNFSYSLKSKNYQRYFPRIENPFTEMKNEEKVKLFDSIIKKQIDYYMANYNNIIHSLTGGFDSRASLSICKNYLQEISFFTYTLSKQNIDKNSKISKRYEEDKSIVEQFISYLPVNHTFLYLKDVKKPLDENIKNLLSKNSIVEHGQNLLPHYLDYVNKDYTLHIRGNASGLLKSPYLSTTEIRGTSYLIKKFISNMHLKKGNVVDDVLYNFLKEEIEDLGYNQNHFGYDGLDLAFWEIRTGRFQTEVFNESDIAFDSLNPVNIRALLSIGLSFPLELRKSNYISNELINMNIPLLNFFGKNELSNLYEQTKVHDKELKNIIQDRKSFDIYNNRNEKIKEINKKTDYIYIPESLIDEGNYASIIYKFKKKTGFAKFEIVNSYSATKGSNYLKYSIHVNDELIIWEDISKWKYENSISIFNLIESDIIEIRVQALRTAKAQSWEKASITKILNYSETKFDNKINSRVLFSSPYSKVEDN